MNNSTVKMKISGESVPFRCFRVSSCVDLSSQLRTRTYTSLVCGYCIWQHDSFQHGQSCCETAALVEIQHFCQRTDVSSTRNMRSVVVWPWYPHQISPLQCRPTEGPNCSNCFQFHQFPNRAKPPLLRKGFHTEMESFLPPRR